MVHLRHQKDSSEATVSLNIRLRVMPTSEEQDRIAREAMAIVEVWNVLFDEQEVSFRVLFSGGSSVEKMQARIEALFNSTTTK